MACPVSGGDQVLCGGDIDGRGKGDWGEGRGRCGWAQSADV